MGNQPEINDLSIGEIQFSPDGFNASISCYLTEAANISIIVQDEIGRSRIEERYYLEKGFGHFTFSVTHLSAGTYHAWIELLGKTFIRNFQIAKTNGENNWLKKLKGIFE